MQFRSRNDDRGRTMETKGNQRYKRYNRAYGRRVNKQLSPNGMQHRKPDS